MGGSRLSMLTWPAASLTSLGLCLASPSTLCAVSRPVLFLSHLDVLPSFPHRTHTLPPAQCVWHGHSGNSGRRKEKEERRRAWIATTPQRKRDERPSHRGRESPLPYYWPTVPKRFQVQISFCLVFSQSISEISTHPPPPCLATYKP